MGQGVFRDQKGAADIDRHHRVEIGHVGFIDLGAARDAGTVDHRMQARQAGQSAFDLVLVGDVADTAVLDGRRDPVDGGCGGAFRRGGLGNGQSEAGGGAWLHYMLAGTSHAPSESGETE